jgi:uncharacterized membrane protein YqhA
MSSVEARWQAALWRTRWIVVVAVVGSMLLAFAAFAMGAIETLAVLSLLVGYVTPGAGMFARDGLRGELIASIVKATDTFLVGTILVVVALGLYELFINKIQAAEHGAGQPRLMLATSLDVLKDRIARLVLLVLVVEFFGAALQFKTTTGLDLLVLAVGVFLIAAALFLTRQHNQT